MKGGKSSMKRLTLSGTRRGLEPALRRVLHVYWRFARAMTLGVRGLVIDAGGGVFLVKHRYVSGWDPARGRDGGAAAAARNFLKQSRLPPRSRRALRGARISPIGGARPQQRDHRAWLFF